MKKYLSIVGLLTLLLSLTYYFYYFDGSLYLPNHLFGKSAKTNFQVKGRNIYQQQTASFFEVKGVDLEPSFAGYHQNELSLKKHFIKIVQKSVAFSLVHYESKKYGWQHLISFSNSPTTDPFRYRKSFEAQAPKYVSLNIEHIQSSNKVKAGTFAAYKALDFHPDYKDYLLFSQTGVSQATIKQVKNLTLAQGYVNLLAAFHKSPVLITGFGYSTARGVDKDKIDQTVLPMTETIQGQRIVSDYKSFRASGAVGGTINAWQDDWNARGWNTSFATDKHSNFLWGDVQVYNQGYGLLGFQNAWKTHRIDGKKGKEEWQIPLSKERDGRRFLSIVTTLISIWGLNVKKVSHKKN
ncbi:Uncharacterised protein [Streptococcus dysgalactiae]|nr:Uncharacterised protein [Streptococcus dysgalactiae]